MACGCGAGCAAGACASACAAGACASACAATACSGALVAMMAANNLRSNSDYDPEPFDILCKNCKHDSEEHSHKGCNHTDGFFHKTKCSCKHFNFDNEKLEKAKNEIIDVLFKHLKQANELQNDEVVA